jgi:ubiquinone/menaquinone biosynthesis C-methylase UbiE
MELQSLNVGCGSDLWGDVRVDVAFNFLSIDCKPTVLADAQHLPFKDRSFETVKANHVLEHLEKPFKAVNELIRVATKKVILTFPTELDVLGWIVPYVLPFPRFSILKMACQTRKNNLHLWIVNPTIIEQYLTGKGWESSCSRNTLSVFAFFEGGRKAKHFKWLTKHFKIPYEYAISAKKLVKTDW